MQTLFLLRNFVQIAKYAHALLYIFIYRFFPHKLGKFYSYAFVSAEQQGATAAIINQAVKLIFIGHNN